MAQEERLQILQMVADKKITASEAAELLRALDAGKAPGAPTQPAPAASPIPPTPPTPPNTQGQGTVIIGPGSGLGSLIEDIVDRVTSAFSDSFDPRYEWTEEVAGEFAYTEVPIRIMTGNGRVEVRSWDQPGYKATIRIKARGASEAEARAKAGDVYSVKADAAGFELETRRWEWRGYRVDVTLMVPRDKQYRLETRTGNGHVVLEGIAMPEGNATTGNGSLTCRTVAANQLRLRSGNGTIDVEGDIAHLVADSGNGSVGIRPYGERSQSLEAHTGNGSVNISTRRLPTGVGVRVEAHTGMGGVDVNVPNLVYDRDMRAVGHKQVIARSANYDQASVRVDIRARTGMGSVSVD